MTLKDCKFSCNDIKLFNSYYYTSVFGGIFLWTTVFDFLKNSKNKIRGNIYFKNCNVKGVIVLKSNDINFCLRQNFTLGINNSESNIVVEKGSNLLLLESELVINKKSTITIKKGASITVTKKFKMNNLGKIIIERGAQSSFPENYNFKNIVFNK